MIIYDVLVLIRFREEVSVVFLQRKFFLNYKKAKEIQEKWLQAQPKEPSFEERLKKFNENWVPKKSPHKRRHTPFFLNGKMLDTWEEAQIELELMKKAKNEL